MPETKGQLRRPASLQYKELRESAGETIPGIRESSLGQGDQKGFPQKALPCCGNIPPVLLPWLARDCSTPLLPYLFHAIGSSPLQVPPIGLCPSPLLQSFTISLRSLVPPSYHPHAHRPLVSGACPTPVLKLELSIVLILASGILHSVEAMNCSRGTLCKDPSSLFAADHITEAVRAFVRARLGECVARPAERLRFGEAFERSLHLALQHRNCRARDSNNNCSSLTCLCLEAPQCFTLCGRDCPSLLS